MGFGSPGFPRPGGGQTPDGHHQHHGYEIQGQPFAGGPPHQGVQPPYGTGQPYAGGGVHPPYGNMGIEGTPHGGKPAGQPYFNPAGAPSAYPHGDGWQGPGPGPQPGGPGPGQAPPPLGGPDPRWGQGPVQGGFDPGQPPSPGYGQGGPQHVPLQDPYPYGYGQGGGGYMGGGPGGVGYGGGYPPYGGGPQPGGLNRYLLIGGAVLLVLLLGLGAWFIARREKPGLPPPVDTEPLITAPGETEVVRLLINGGEGPTVDDTDVVISWIGQVTAFRLFNAPPDPDQDVTLEPAEPGISVPWTLVTDADGRATVHMFYADEVGVIRQTHLTVTVDKPAKAPAAATQRPASTPAITYYSKLIDANGKERDGGNGFGYFRPGESLSWRITATNADGIAAVKFYFRNDVTETFYYNGETSIEKTWHMTIPKDVPNGATMPVVVKVTGTTGGEVKTMRNLVVDSAGPVIEVGHTLPDASGIWQVPIKAADHGAGVKLVWVRVETAGGNATNVETEEFCMNGYTKPGCRSVDRSFVYTVDMNDFFGGATYNVVARGVDWVGNQGELYKGAQWHKPAPPPTEPPVTEQPPAEQPATTPKKRDNTPKGPGYVAAAEEPKPEIHAEIGELSLNRMTEGGRLVGYKLVVPVTTTAQIPSRSQGFFNWGEVTASITGPDGTRANLNVMVHTWLSGGYRATLSLDYFHSTFRNHKAGDRYQIEFRTDWNTEGKNFESFRKTFTINLEDAPKWPPYGR